MDRGAPRSYDRLRMFATDCAYHCPPRAVVMPLAFSASAISLRVRAPAFWATRMEAFSKSETAGETSAMANLGYELLNAGFASEAKEICSKALAIEGFNANVGHLSVALREHTEAERKSVKATLDQAKERAAYYASFGNSLGIAEL